MARLPWEVLNVILLECMKQDLEASKNILKDAPIMSTELLLLNRGIYNFIIGSTLFHRLRLWKLLCRIPNRPDPIKLAVGTSDTNWTLLEVEARNERVNANHYEDLLVMDEALPLSGKRRNQWIPQGYNLVLKNAMDRQVQIPFFEFNDFLVDIVAFATVNTMSIWLWKRSHTFFKKEMLSRKKQQEKEEKEHGSLQFKPVFFTQQQRELMVWSFPLPERKGSTETTALHSTELFRRLI